MFCRNLIKKKVSFVIKIISLVTDIRKNDSRLIKGNQNTFSLLNKSPMMCRNWAKLKGTNSLLHFLSSGCWQLPVCLTCMWTLTYAPVKLSKGPNEIHIVHTEVTFVHFNSVHHYYVCDPNVNLSQIIQT